MTRNLWTIAALALAALLLAAGPAWTQDDAGDADAAAGHAQDQATDKAAADDANAKAAPADDDAPKSDDDTTTVDEIVHRTNYVSYYQGRDGRAQARMVIADAQGRERKREFTILRYDVPRKKAAGDDENPAADGDAKPAPADGDAKDAAAGEAAEGADDEPDPGKAGTKPPYDAAAKKKDRAYLGEQRYYVYFRRPADVNKMVFLVWKHLGEDDDRWLYVPELDNVNRISGRDKRGSFVGSHFVYEDVSGRNVDLDKHELVPGETNRTYYVLKNTPKDPDLVDFAYYKMWIHRGTFLVVQTRYYDENDTEYRRYTAGKVRKIQGFPTVVQAEMADLRSGGKTVLTYDEVEYDVGLWKDPDIFTQRYLRRPPREYLK